MDWLKPWRRSDAGSGYASTWPVLDFLTETVNGQSAADLYATQPHLRTVIGFLTRNVAQLGLAAVDVDKGARRTSTNSDLRRFCIKPNRYQTMYGFLESVVGDLALYDNAYMVMTWSPLTGAPELTPLRPTWVQAVTGLGPYDVTGYEVKYPEALSSVTIPASHVLHIHGWNPEDARIGLSPVRALKETLSEQMSAAIFRGQLWRRGGRVGAFLSRPADAPEWTPASRTKFLRQFRSQFTGNSGENSGGVPLLEDGMTMQRLGFSSKEEEYVESTKLALQVVAAAYYVNPTMVGLLDNANYSNVREFRRMLYGETLGPTITQIGQSITSFILGHLEIDDDGSTVIIVDTDSRTRGTFEEQMGVASSAVGGPVLTQNEFRGQLGYPPIEGGDEMNKPLNITKPGDDEPIPAADDEPPADEAGTEEEPA